MSDVDALCGSATTTTAAAVAAAAVAATGGGAAAARNASADIIFNVVLKNSIERTYISWLEAEESATKWRNYRAIKPFYAIRFARQIDLLAFSLSRSHWAAAVVMPFTAHVYESLREAWKRAWRFDANLPHMDDVGRFSRAAASAAASAAAPRSDYMYFAFHTDHAFLDVEEYGVDYVVSTARYYMTNLERLVRSNSKKRA